MGTFCFRDNVGSPVWLHGHPGVWGEQGAPGEVSAGHQDHPGPQRHQHRDGALLVSVDDIFLYRLAWGNT